LQTQYLAKELTPGQAYTFKVRASNIYGYGDFSAETTFIPADVPDQLSPATTSNVLDHVEIAWTTPNNNGAVITSYTV
jgi:hypothetical protein